jgi:hypothetical protein
MQANFCWAKDRVLRNADKRISLFITTSLRKIINQIIFKSVRKRKRLTKFQKPF